MGLMMLWRQLCVEMCEGWGSEQDCCGRLNITQVRRRRAVSRYLVSVHSVPRYLVSAHCTGGTGAGTLTGGQHFLFNIKVN